MNIFQKLIKQIFRLSPILMGVGMVFFGVGEALGQTQTITNPGAGTFTVPAGVTSITVEVWGGGGRGGSKSGSNGAAAGGGGGAYSRSVLSVTPGQIINYEVGFGAEFIQPGGDTWFLSPTAVMAKGGNSVNDNGTTGATGGSEAAGFGTVRFSGGNGANSGSDAGGGGSSAGIVAIGNNATNRNGATAPIGGGNGGAGKQSGNGPSGQGRGDNGTAPGGGGGGGVRSNASGTDISGGYGGNGQIRISYIALTSAAGTDNQSVCNGDPIINTTYSIPIPISSSSPNLVISNLPAGLSSSYDNLTNTITIFGTPTASGTYTISTRPTYLSAASVTLTRTGSVTVNPKPAVTNMDTTVCSASGFTVTPFNVTNGVVPGGTTYSWSPPAVTGGLTGGASGTNASSISGTLNNPTNIAQTATYTVTPRTGSCVGTPFSVTVTVNPTPTISPMNDSVCTGSAFSLTPTNGTNGIVPAGTTYSWSLPVVTGGMTGGATGSGASTISGTLTNTTSSPQTATYTVTPVSSACTGTPFTVTITVNPNNSASPPSFAPAVCINTPLTNITHTTSGATGIGAAVGLPAGISANWSGNTITISGTPTVSGVFSYTIPLTGGCGAVSATGTITVNANNTVSGPSSTPTLCVDTPLTAIMHSTTGATGISNAGVSGANGLPAGLSATWAGDLITISGTPTQAGSFNYSIPLTGGCFALFAEGTITVNPATIITNENLADQRICDGQNFASLSINATGTGTLSYQWFSNDNPNKTGAVPVGTNSNSFTPPSNVVGTKYFYVEVTGGCTIATSSFSRATVEPITLITTEPSTADDVECFGDGFDPLTVVAQGADLTYQWYAVPTQVNSGGTPVPGAITSNFTPPSTTEGSAYYYVVVTGYCSSVTSAVSGQHLVTPPITTITQNPSTNPQTVCQGDAFSSISVQAIGEGDVTYQWYSNTTSTNTGGTLISGETNPTFNPSSGIVGTLYYYAMASSDCGTVPTEVSGAFTVTPLTEIEVENLAGQVICDVDTFDPISVSAIGTGAIEYQWYSNTTSSTIGGTLIPGEINSTFTPPTTAQGTTTYYFVEVSSECGPDVTSTVSGPFTINLDNTVAAPSSSPTLCINTGLPTITIATTGATGIANDGDNSGVNGLPAGVSATWSNDVITISGTPSQSGSFNYSIPLLGGCGVVDAIGTITVTPDNTAAAPSSTPTLCINTPLPIVTVTTTGATGIANDGDNTGVNGLPAGVSATWAGGVITISGTPTQSGTFNYSIPMTGGCGAVTAIGTITVTPDKTAAVPSSDPTVCISSSLPIVTIVTTGATGISNDGDNTGVNGLPDGVSASWSGGVITISGTPTESGLFNYSIPLTGGCGAVNATGTITVNPLATVGPTSIAFPSVCKSDPSTLYFTQSTTGVTSIGTPNGLPPGITASFDSITGDITFSGTATTPGLYSYNIPLNGNCISGLNATGIIDVTPDYELTAVSSVSATVTGGTASITIFGDLATLPNGTYEVTYILDDGINPPAEFTSSSFSVGNGRGTFASIPLAIEDVDVYQLTIKNIKKVTDVCTIDLDINDPINTTYFSVCGAPYNSNGSFFVPAGIFEITIQAFGAGASGESNTVTIPVIPGETLSVVVGQNTGTGTGRNTWVTRDSSDPDPQSSSLIYVNGGGGSGPNGQVNISYSCPDANDEDCMEVIDDGAVTGTTIIRFTCDDTWQIPEGLVEFSIYAVGGGGGGGMGPTAGGGGGGGISSTTVTSNAQFGIPAGNFLDIKVGNGGQGANTVNTRGINGGNSEVTANIPDPEANININLIALGGGGGGSFSNRDGRDGASGGGGAFSDQASDIQGMGGNGTPEQGNNGGNGGRGNNVNHARAGGGGGGAGGSGENGSGSGVGQSQAGNGGNGSSFGLNGTPYGYGAGGGGIGYNFNSNTNDPGLGGSVNGIRIGGDATNQGIGNPGTAFTGSGGGAGTFGGGAGGQGVVYITYFNFSILNVEYDYFNANYNSQKRSGDLSWATTKEWENSHFEIERAVNNVKTWTKVGEVEGQGYSDTTVEYEFTDLDLPATGGNIFYRLKQVDMDGEYSYSVTRSIQVEPLDGSTKWIAYPNPSNMGSAVNVALIDDSGYTDGTIQIRVSDVRGVYQTFSVSDPADVSNAVNSYLENARPGMYILQILWGNKSEQLKLVRK